METTRRWHLDQLENAIPVLTALLRDVRNEQAKTLRDGVDGWTISEVVGHLLDLEGIFIERARLTLTEDTPDLPFPDHEVLVRDNAYAQADISALIPQWAARRQQFIALLEAVTGDAQWERPAIHPTRGAFSLNKQLFLAVWHDMNHFKQLGNILNA